MPSFGEKLKLEREKRKISLDQISSTTKIGTRMLQALEEEKFAQLPGGIFNKGFVRAYARTLGLDEDQAVADYLEASGEAPPPRPETPGRDASRENAPRPAPARITPVRIMDDNFGRLEIRAETASRQLPWGIFAVVLLIIALALSLWSYRRRERDRLAHQPKAAALLSQQRSAPLSNTSVQPSPSPNAASQSPQIGEPQNSSAAPQQASTSPSTPTENTAVTTVPGEFLVVIHASGESWLSPVVDGKPIGSETMRAGDIRSFRARDRVIVKAGNASVLEFRLNGKLLTIGAEPGQSNTKVRTVTFGPEGIVPPVTSAIPPASQ